MNAKQPLNQQVREACSEQIKNLLKERYISADWYAREWQALRRACPSKPFACARYIATKRWAFSGLASITTPSHPREH